jgi:hypothetical protein
MQNSKRMLLVCLGISIILLGYYFLIVGNSSEEKVAPVKVSSVFKNKGSVGDIRVGIFTNGLLDTAYFVEQYQRAEQYEDPTPYFEWVKISPSFKTIQQTKSFIEALQKRRKAEELEKNKIELKRVGELSVSSLLEKRD